MGGYVVAHLKRDIVQLGEKLRRILFSKCICFYWFLVFLKFWIFSILNTYFSTTISVISDLVLLSFELRILNFGFFKSHCQPLNFGFFLWSWALKTRLEGSVFFAGGVLNPKELSRGVFKGRWKKGKLCLTGLIRPQLGVTQPHILGSGVTPKQATGPYKAPWVTLCKLIICNLRAH